jgi:hypothetical protein
VFEIGNTLREARRARGLEILECEERTKIRGKYLRALEAEQFDVLPSPTYVRGFLKTYADFLELDSQLVLDEHQSRCGTVNPISGEIERPGRPPRRRERRSSGLARRRRSEVHLLWLAIGGVMGLGLLVWMGVGDTTPETPPLPPSDNAAVAPAAPGPAAPAIAAPANTGPARGEAPQRLTIVLSGIGGSGSYVEVRGKDAEGREVFRGTLEAGAERTFTVSRGLWVRSGNTDGLAISVNGRRYELAGGVADFQVTAGGVERVTG